MNYSTAPKSPDYSGLIQEHKERIADLREVISWSIEKGTLSVGQRICLHQEIASLLQEIDALTYAFPIMRSYRISPALEEKIQHFMKVIINTGWEKQEFITY